jgi:hypothetical protein
MPQQIKVAEMPGNRIETGGVEFTYPSGRSDWPGMFIRGDDSIYLGMAIQALLDAVPKDDITLHFYRMRLKEFCEELHEDVIVQPQPPTTPKQMGNGIVEEPLTEEDKQRVADLQKGTDLHGQESRNE